MAEPPVIYLLDASMFIQAHRNYYAFDLAPGFWNNLLSAANEGMIKSIDKVYKEIERGQDELFEWVETSLPAGFFADTDNSAAILNAYQNLMEWAAAHLQYNDNAKSEFAEYDYADPWLVATALVKRYVVVSQEVADGGIKRKIPLPNVCQEFGVRHIDTFTFLRECNFRM